jgi:hypothetical protein
LRRTSFSFSILSRATPFHWLSNKSGLAPLAQAARRLLNRGSMPERAGSDKGGLSTAIRAARVTLPISESSSGKAMAFRFVHTTDIRLDLPLATQALREPDLADSIGGATRKALAALE